MTLNADILLDRIQLKQKIKKWQVATFLVALVSVLVLVGPSGNQTAASVGKKDYIARVTLEGMLLDDPYRDQVFLDLEEDKSAKAVIVAIDSPGGTTAAGEALYTQLRDLSKAGKPVVVVMKTLAASGGYMTALGADHIVARRGTITGSIGVIMESPEVTNLLENLGVKFNILKTAELKASPSPFEKMSPKAQAAMMTVLNDFYDYFVDIVAERRKMDRSKALELADGRVYTGYQAFKNGLIDEIGGEKEALKWLREQKKISKDLEVEDIDTKKPEEGLRDMFFGDMKESKIYQSLTTNGVLAVWNPYN